MRKLLYLIIILCFANICRAQTRHTITAAVVDSLNNQPLEFVTVAVLQVKDSSLVSYTLTDKKGIFTLHNIQDNVPLRILLSYVGYESLHIGLNFPKTDSYNLGKLYLNSKKLTEVTIKGEIVPILIKKDTIEFNAEAFKVRPNALVQDLLKKLPGMQVDRDGTLAFNGQSVSKVKVNGKDFFAKNYKIATQNLDADMIAKVQVYDDRENDPDHLQPEYEVKKIINLKFKKEFTKSLFGKFAVGGGTQDRYQVDGTFIKTINDLQMAVIGNSNNLNGTNFTSPLTSPFQFGPRSGIQQLTTTGVNIDDNFGKNVKVNLTYNFTGNNSMNNNTKNVAQFLHDTTITANSINKSHTTGTSHTINGTVEWNPNTDTKWRYVPQFTYNSNNANSSSQSVRNNNFTSILNQDATSDNNNGSNTQYQHNLSYYHSYKLKGESISITNNVTINPSNSVDYNMDKLVSYVAGLNSDTLNRQANTSSKNTSMSLDVGYHYPLSKTIIGGITYSGAYINTGASLFTYNQDLKTGLYDIFLQSQSNDLTRNLWGESLHPEISYSKKRTNFNAGFIILQQQINNRFGNNIADLNQSYAYLLPSLSLTLGKVTFSYAESVEQPSISDLQPITIVYSQLYSFMGNPDLKPVRRRNFYMRYFNFGMENGLFSSFNLQATQEGNSITRKTIITPQGAQLSTPINGQGRYSTSINYSVNKRFKKIDKWEISETSNLSAGYGHNYYFVNNQPGYQDTYYGTFSQGISVDWNDIINVEASYKIVPNITKYQLINLPTQSFATQEVNIPLRVQWPKRIIFDLNYSYIYNPQQAHGFNPKSNLLSISIARLLQQKDKGEFRLTCYDILNQSVSAYHYAENNTINDIQYQTLKRYFMLSYSYKFNKITTKEKK
jgi:hypothetical protein